MNIVEQLRLHGKEGDTDAEGVMLQGAAVLENYHFEIQRLKKAFNIIFPQPTKRPDGSEVDNSADENLEAAIIDFEGGNANGVTLDTLKRILNQLVEARQTVCD